MNSLKTYQLTTGGDKLNMELTSMEVVDEIEDIRYTTYGVRVSDQAGNIVFAALDVDTCMEYVQRFIELCAQNDVSAIHLHDLLEDYMA